MIARLRAIPPGVVLVLLLLAGSVCYGFGPYFSDHLIWVGFALLIPAFLILFAAIGQQLRRNE